MDEDNVILMVKNLTKLYPVRKGFLQSLTTSQTEYVHAVDGLSFKIKRGETLGLVGESGCGKTTTGFLTVDLIDRTDGEIYFKGTEIYNLTSNEFRELRRKIQIIFQNPYDSLSPRFTVFDIIAEPLRLLNVYENEAKIKEMVFSMLEAVGLKPAEEFYERYPHELSGGQRQRVGVARAFVLDPEYVVADEPVSNLDVSLRIGVLNIMKKLIDEFGTAFLFITHDLALARYMCDRIAVMYLGIIVEKGTAEQVTQTPKHPYTRALIEAVPSTDPHEEGLTYVPIIGEISDGVNIPSGCRFRDRCLYAVDDCRTSTPQLVEIEEDHFVACFRVSEVEQIVHSEEKLVVPAKDQKKEYD